MIHTYSCAMEILDSQNNSLTNKTFEKIKNIINSYSKTKLYWGLESFITFGTCGQCGPVQAQLLKVHCPNSDFRTWGCSGGTWMVLTKDWNVLLVSPFCKVWVAKVRAHTHTCEVRSHVCVRNPFWKVCGMCMRAARSLVCDCTFVPFLEQNWQKMLLFKLF